MSTITRDHQQAANRTHDIIIVGGGIYGVALAHYATQLKLSTLLVEKHDFGWSTSFNHLRTVHGGLRYLQNLDLPRFFESVSARSWFMKEFPGLTTPLPCLMPLYGNGPYRPSVFKAALGLNDILSRRRNRGVPPGQELQNGRVISAEEVARRFPLVDRQGLKGGAVWYDGAMPCAQLVLMEMLKRACSSGAVALNYTDGEKLLTVDSTVTGLRCRDRESGAAYEFRSPIVINAAGPWCRSFAASFHDDDPELFRYSIAWNVLFDRKALSDHSLALKPKRPGSSMYFIHGFNGLIMGGTVHAPWEDIAEEPLPHPDEVAAYIDDLNLAVPGLCLRSRDVQQIFAGLLPARKQGTNTLAAREVIKDHGATGGPKGAYSVSGVKLTTARLVAQKVLHLIFPRFENASVDTLPTRAPVSGPVGLFDLSWYPTVQKDEWKSRLRSIIEDESVLHLDDLIVRRTNIGDNPRRARAAAPAVAALFDWDESRRAEEVRRLEHFFAKRSYRDVAAPEGKEKG